MRRITGRGMNRGMAAALLVPLGAAAGTAAPNNAGAATRMAARAPFRASFRAGNVLGMMPHPERAADPALGGTDGAALFRSLVAGVVNA